VNALGEDLARFLEDRPVLAQPDSRWYRLRKFVSRNRLPVAAGSAILLAVVGGALVSLRQSRIAIQEKEHAQEVERFVQSIFGEANPYADAGRKMTAVELLHNARDDIDRRFQSRLDLRVALLQVVGSSLRNLGDTAAARSALQAGLADSEKLYGPRHIETLRLRALLSDVYGAERDAAALRAELATLVPLARAASTVDAEPLVRALKNQGLLAFMEGRTEEIAPPIREALALSRSRLGEHHPLTVDASNSLVEAYQASYDTPREVALAESERALKLALEAYGQNSDHAQVIRSRDMRARVLGVVGYYREAIAEQGKAIDALQRSIGLDDRTAVEMLESLGSWERRVGDVPASLRHGAQAQEILEKLGDTQSPDYAYILTNQGNNLLAARRPLAAEATLARAEEIYVGTYGPVHWDTLTAHFNRAMALAYGGRAQQALASFRVLDDPKVEIKMAWWMDYVRGTVERLAGHAREAVEALERADAGIPETPRAPWDHARVLTELGQAQVDLERLDEAEATLASAEALDEKLGIRMSPAYADVVLARARVDLARKAAARALPRVERVDAFWREFDGESRDAGVAALWFSRVYRELGREREAGAQVARAERLAGNRLR
jgi:serine/threonine-protein kinase